MAATSGRYGRHQFRQRRAKCDQRGGNHAVWHGHAHGRFGHSGDHDLSGHDDTCYGRDQLERGQPSPPMPAIRGVRVLGSSLTRPTHREQEVGRKQCQQQEASLL